MKLRNITFIILLIFSLSNAFSQALTEDDYYQIVTIPTPEGVELEVGGMVLMPDGSLAACTRRGEVWKVDNPYMFGGGKPVFTKIAEGLHEPLGLNYIDGKLWATQRGEVTILHDDNSDGQIDRFQQYYQWPLSGNYHQYSYGPEITKDGKKLFTLNLDWIGHGASQTKWRGWMFTLDDEGKMEPWATGLRSPAGFMVNDEGDIFYAENQGDWVGSGRVTHLEKGDFAGNPAGLKWADDPTSPVKLRTEDIPDTGQPLFEAAQKVEGIKAPAVWFPHTLMGISTSDMVQDLSGGKFGPFSGQYFVGDQGHSKIMRMSLEKVDGVYQGACYPFREGFMSGILRMEWGFDQSMFVGQTSRGWAATGRSEFGLQRLVWSGKTPFEIKSITSASDGFILEFTEEINEEKAYNPSSYDIQSFTYKYHHTYGSPIINQREVKIKGIELSEDRKTVHLAVDTMRLGYIFGITAEGITNDKDENLLHNVGYFTLNRINNTVAPLNLDFYAVAEETMEHDHASMDMPTDKLISEKRINEMPASWNGEVDETILIGTVPGLKFDTKLIQAKAGSRVKIVFQNNDDMLHNLLIVNPKTVEKVGQAALNMGLKGPNMGYVPEMEDVLYHTGILQPESSETIYFQAPKKKGDYHFVCTFPGHYTVMNGIFRVK
ncbi:auracyanin family protein [Jiulongibacter sediminis]|uniref:Large, multifunctional secreted protein n=1 Tax=Jiulongibacter sediminis TaxID=1605367 RepID=A0A0P7BXJ9_9BACT|nr:auracyanin family protein [Jiulongibacter sediminis]KPM49617.1 large, multifunctional secreted protein [Jiulongibacter sediminis]TBX26655.1 large, multifunctional secreted protein [Jiulongibacter sediminis]